MSIFSSTSPKRHPSINDETTSTVIVPKFVAPDFKRRQLIFDSFQKLQQNTCYTQQHVTAQQYAQQATPAPVKAAFSVESTQAPASTTPTVADVRTAKGTRVHTWGAGYHGQLGVSSSRKKCRLAPSPIEFVSEPVLLVACGGFHSAILTDTGALYTWGDGRVGQLGNLARKHNMHSTPHLVDWFPTQKLIVTHVACGEYHTVAIAGGKMYSFGQGRYGQLGHGHRLDERFPRKIETDKKLGNFVMVKCGDRHTVALNDANQVITFGSGQHGQLGLGNGSDQLRPVMVEALMDKKIVHVDAGATLTAAIDDEGILYIWGFGESLYPKDESNIAHLPRRVPVREKVKQVSCGQGHLLMLTHGGDVYSMGMASMGQLGHGSNSNVRTPRLVLKGKEIQQVACGRYHSMCVTAYGIVYSFGCGESGQCGHNGLENEKLPRVIEAILPNVVGQIACGEHHSICLSSIEHSSISQDVLNWATIEAEELKIKKNMLEQFPNGLKTKQLLAMEEKRKQLILQLADSLRHEREKDMSYAQQQLRSIQSREAIVADVRTLISEGSDHGMDDMMENKPSDGNFAIAIEGVDVDAHGTALPPTDNTVTTTTSTDAASPTQPSVTSVAAAAALQRAMNSYEDSAINTQAIVDAAIAAGTQAAGTQETIPQSQSPNGSPHESRPQSRDVISPTQENLLLVPDPMSPFSSSHPLHHRLRPRPELSPSHTPSMHSRALLAHGKSSTGRRWPTSHPSHDDSDSDSEEEQEKKKKKKKGVLGPIVSQAGVKPHTPPSVAASSSPSHAPTTRTSASPGSTMRTMKRSQSQVMTIVPSSSSRPIQALPNVPMLRSSSTSALLSPTDSTTSQSSQDLAYQPIAPRISFIEKSTQQLNKVLSTIITTDVLKAEPSGYDTLIKLQKEYNRLKDERQLKSKRVMNMTRALQLLQPTKEDHEIHVKNAAAVKELKMKLVTLNTRLMESDENKRNYELYIIRMKEEDLQLSKQIDHIRRLVTEYDRLVAKLEKMNARVQGQKQEIDEESQAFHRDVAEFMIFCDDTMSRYRRILNDQYRHSVAIEKQLSLRIARQEEHRMSTIHKLESEWNATQEQTTQIKSKLESWEDKLQYYEKRYRKLTSTTGLTKAEHIIAKFYFNDEITADLKKESEERKELVARLEAERTALTAELEHWRSSYVGIAWKDVMKAESHEHEVASRTRKDEADVDRLMTKLAIVLQGMVTLSKQVKINVEQKDEEEEEEEQQRLATAAATATSKVEEEKEIISNPPTRPMSRLATSRLSPPPQEEVKEATSSPFHVELDALIANINKPKSPVVTSLGLPTGPISTRGSPSARLSQRRRDREWRECHLDNVPLWVSTLEEQLTNLMSMVEKNRIRQAERKRADELKAQAAQEAQPKTLNELIALARKVKQQTTEYDEAMAQKQTTTGTTVTAI